MRYRLEFSAVGERVEVLDEAIEETVAQEGENDDYRLGDLWRMGELGANP